MLAPSRLPYGCISAPLRAGLVYALLVFAAGFVLGAIRIGLVVPRFGATRAVLAEAPIMLLASWWICRRCSTYFHVTASLRARALMGTVALTTLLAAEMALAAAAFAQAPLQYVLHLKALPDFIGLVAQLAFATFPLLQAMTSLSTGQSASGHRT